MKIRQLLRNARLQLEELLQLLRSRGPSGNRTHTYPRLERGALPLSYRAAPLDGFEPSLPDLESGLQPSAFQGTSAGTGTCTTASPHRNEAPRYLGFPCGARFLSEQDEAVTTAPGELSHGDLLAEQRHVATQPSSFGVGLDDNGGQLVVDIGLEVQGDPETTLVGGGRDASQGLFVGHGHQDNEVALNHPAGRHEAVLSGELERGVRGLRRLQSERQIGTSHDVQPVERGVVLNLQESVLQFGYSVLSTRMTLLDSTGLSRGRADTMSPWT